MHRPAVLLLVLSATSACAQQPPKADAAQPDAAKPRTLFNGTDLSGWEGDPTRWSVADGAIVGTTTAADPLERNTFLIWTGGEVGDFELTLKYHIAGEQDWANSGVQYRSKRVGAKEQHVLNGYQADIDLDHVHVGILYEEGGRGILASRGQKVTLLPGAGKQRVTRKVTGSTGDPAEIAGHVKRGQWNEYRIVARGATLTHTINGHDTVVVVDEDADDRALKGLLGLQLHQGTPMTVKFKDIVLKPLP